MAVQTTNNKPINPRGNDQSPLAFNRAKLYSGKALDFDGTNDNVEVADDSSLDFTTAMSAFCYARVDSTSASGHLFSKYDYGTNQRSWTIQQDSGNLRVIVSVNGFSGTNTKDYYSATFENTSDYYFVGFTLADNVLKLYVNGQEVTPTKNNDVEITTIFSGSAKVAVGSIQNSGVGASFFDGKIANARAFNVALTAAQVSDLYNNPEKIVPTGVSNDALKLWLPMMEGAGTTAYDGSGNGNHGTISGATWTHGIGAPVSQTAVIDWNKGSNLMVYSEEFDSGVYGGSNFVVNANATTAPDGKNTADKITFTATGVTPEIFDQFTNVANTMHIGSVFLKNDTIGSVQLEIIGGGPGILGQTTIDLTDGSLSASVGDYTPVATDAGNGWYRVSVGDTGSATIASPSLKIKHVGTDGAFYAWGIQVEAADSLGAYIPNHTGTPITSDVLLPQGLTSGRDITGVNLFENVRKQGALNLDGNSWAEVHDNASLDITDAITLECWYNTDYLAGNNMLISKWSPYADGQRSYLFYMTEYEYLYFSISADGTSPSTLSSSNVYRGGWKHFVATYDGANMRLYIDGAAENSKAETLTIKNGSFKIGIGNHQGDTSALAEKPIAQPRIYNRALTAEEVQRNYDAGKNIYK